MGQIQFSVRQLLILTTAVAMISGLVVALDLPAFLPPALVFGYLTYLSAWLIVRGPSVIAGLSEVAGRRRRLREQRRQLELEVEAWRVAHRTRGTPEVPPRRGDLE